MVVRRDGDPAAGVAIELRFEGEDATVRAAAIGALVGARLEKAFHGVGDGSVQVVGAGRVARVRALVPQLGASIANAIDAALTTPIVEGDGALPAIKRALEAVAGRPVDDPALARATRCLDRPTRPLSSKSAPEQSVATIESWRASAVNVDAVVVGVVGSGVGVDAFSTAWRASAALAKSTNSKPMPSQPALSSAVALAGHATEGAVLVIEGMHRSVVPTALAALGDPNGALTMRLRAEGEWRARGIAGASRPEGGCVVIELEASASHPKDKEWNPERVAMRASVALEVARQEVELAVDSARVDDAEAARTAIGLGGDPREAADRAAWWGWTAEKPSARASSSTLLVPAIAVSKGAATDVDAVLSLAQTKLDQALQRARISWARAEIELRSRVEAGQGEVWAALASPCSVAHESTADAGLAAVALNALVSASAARASNDGVIVEPWAATVGVGVVAHAAARNGESNKALAQRVGDAVGRVLLASFPTADTFAIARGEAIVSLGSGAPPSELVRAALRSTLPDRPSWLEPIGTADAVATTGLEASELRLTTLRGGPLRLAVLANGDADQADAVAKGAERWVPRRPGEARACPVTDAGAVPKGSVHSIVVRTGTGVALAFPVDESQREAATLLSTVLDGPGGRLDLELGAAGVTSGHQAKLVRGVGRHALVIVVLSPDANVDAVVPRLRALVEKLRNGGLAADDLARAERERGNFLMHRRIEPRARVVDVFTGELSTATAAPIDLTQLRAVAAKVLDEDRTQLVVARLK